jgi:hypothetical protein
VGVGASSGPPPDRYDSLIRHLQAGREVPLQPRPRRRFGLGIHQVARPIVTAALAFVVAWIGAIAVTDYVRYGVVDTWEGPTTTVESGHRLADCPNVPFLEDVYFPAWIRFDGQVFGWTERTTPIGPDSVGRSYTATRYRHGDLELFRVDNSPEGRAGRQVMVRQGTSSAGAVYRATDCG